MERLRLASLYTLWGLSEPLRTLSRTPIWMSHYPTRNGATGTELLQAASRLRTASTESSASRMPPGGRQPGSSVGESAVVPTRSARSSAATLNSQKTVPRGAVGRLIDRRGGEIEKIGPGLYLRDGELIAPLTRHSDTVFSTGVRPAEPFRRGPRESCASTDAASSRPCTRGILR